MRYSSSFFSFEVRSLECVLEQKSGVQINCVISAGAPACGVIVGSSAVEIRVAGVLGCQHQVLPRPIREVESVAVRFRISIGIAGYITGWKQQRISSTSDVKPAECG